MKRKLGDQAFQFRNMWNNDYNLEFTQKNILPGEEVCNRCGGTGIEPDQVTIKGEWQELCHKCFGEGSVDWIKQLTEE